MTKKRLRLIHKCWLTGLAIFLFLTSSNIIVSAVSLDLFSNTKVSNNSGTTSVAPYLNVANKPVTFTINGTTAIGATAGRTGAKYAFVNVPAQLAGKVQKDGNATVDTTVTVLASDIKAVTGTVLDLVTSLTGLLTTLGLGTLVTNLNSAVTALNKEDFGRQVFQSPVEQYSSTLLRADISQGLLPIITNALILRLKAIQTIVQGITPLPLINVVLNNLLTALTNTISTLGNANSTVSKNLAAASILGSTSVSFPTLVSSPTGLTQDFTAVVRGGIFQTDNFDVQLLSNYGGNTNLYFAAGSLTMKNELLPSSLNFGSHPVQTKVDETWNAYIGGSSANPLQTGTIRIDDTRTTAKAWQLKLAQTNSWVSGQKNLANARLDIVLGGVNSNFQNYFSISNQTVHMLPSDQVTLFSLSATTDSGYFEMPLNQFQLFVPKNTPKQTGTYQTTLQWTISNTP